MSQHPDFAAHRARLLEHLAEDEAVLVFGGPHHLRNADTDYRYHPHADVYWLTGWTDPEVAVFLRPGDEPLTMFVQPKDKDKEVWTGVRPGPDGARESFGADAAHPIGELAKHLPKLLQGVSELHYAIGHDAAHDTIVVGAIRAAAREARKNGADTPETFHAPSKLLHELRLHKSDEELQLMREAARITAVAFQRAMELSAPGVPEHRIEALVEFTYRDQGGTGVAFNTIVAGGHHATVLHYVTNQDLLQEGELLLVDAGCEYGWYSADVTRTWPVSGTFTEPQRRVYQAVLKAQRASIERCRAGRTHKEVHDTSVRSLTESMVALGLLEGEVDALIESEDYKRYYMHGTGHWLGLDVHDVGAYARGGSSRVLAPGMVLTVEPGLYIAADDEDAPEELRGIGVRIEDDVLVTAGDPEVLTAAIPKQIPAVEAACRGERQS